MVESIIIDIVPGSKHLTVPWWCPFFFIFYSSHHSNWRCTHHNLYFFFSNMIYFWSLHKFYFLKKTLCVTHKIFTSKQFNFSFSRSSVIFQRTAMPNNSTQYHIRPHLFDLYQRRWYVYGSVLIILSRDSVPKDRDKFLVKWEKETLW